MQCIKYNGKTSKTMNKECGKIGSGFVNLTLSIVRHIFLGKKTHNIFISKKKYSQTVRLFINRITFPFDKVMKLTFFTTPFISTPILKNNCIFSSSGSISWKKKKKFHFTDTQKNRIGLERLKITTDNVFII